MKTTIPWIALTIALHAEPTVQESVTASQIAAKQRGGSLTVLSQEAPDIAPVPRADSQSIISQSEILHDGEHWTLVPNGAVLHIPEQHAAKIGKRPVGILLQWSEFLAKNPAWIRTHETSFDQASGEKEFPVTETAHWSKQDRVVIAVHQGGPISVARQPRTPPR